jgi:hypothetical protein
VIRRRVGLQRLYRRVLEAAAASRERLAVAERVDHEPTLALKEQERRLPVPADLHQPSSSEPRR